MASVYKRGGKSNRGGSYYIQWFDHTGKRRTKSARTTDKATAERIAAKLDADAALRREGVVDATLDAVVMEAQRSIESHLADYEAALRGRGGTDEHVKRTLRMVRKIAASADLKSASDITADGVNRFAGRLKDGGSSARTIQSYLTAIKGFTKWLLQHHKLHRDSLTTVKKPNPNSDRRHERRMLLPDEWKWLRAVLSNSEMRFNMTSSERLLLYSVAIETGLRSGELRALTGKSIFADDAKPYILAKAGTTKNQKTARQYICGQLAKDLKSHIRRKAPNAAVFRLPHETEMAAMLRADLGDARLLWLHEMKKCDPGNHVQRQQTDFLEAKSHDGELIDFHSLRHTCGAWIAKTGAHAKVVQSIMRHAAITLTMDTYGHLFPGSEADAIGRLGDMMGDAPDTLQATGTDAASVASSSIALQQAQQSGRETVRRDAMRCESEEQISPESPRSKPLKIADLGDAVRRDARENENRPGRTRTRDKGIMSTAEIFALHSDCIRTAFLGAPAFSIIRDNSQTN